MGDLTKETKKSLPRRKYHVPTLNASPADATRTNVAQLRALQAKLAEEQRALQARLEQALQNRRAQYRAQRQTLDVLNGIFLSAPMTDEQVDEAIAQQEWLAANTPLLNQGLSPLEIYDRRNAGTYATEADLQLARLQAEMHNNFFLGGMTSPYISAEYAATHPYAMLQVMRSDAATLPYAMASGISFDSPSLFGAATRGAQQGFLTVGNYGTRLWNATTGAARQAGSMLGDASNASRWGVTTAFGTTPIVAAAQEEEGGNTSSAVLGGVAALGAAALGMKGYKWGKNKGWWGPSAENTASAAESTAERASTKATSSIYSPDKRLFTWERPKSWRRRLYNALYDSSMGGIIDEWNAAAGDATKEAEFINKYNIRSAEGTPLWIDTQVTRPRTFSKYKTETVLQPVMEEVPSSILGSEGRSVMITRQKIGADGKPIMESVEREVRDAYGLPVIIDEPLLDSNGQPVMETYTKSEPKLDAEGKLVVVYDPIESDEVPRFLRDPGAGLYTSKLPNLDKMVFVGPSKSLVRWANARNTGRVGAALGALSVPALLWNSVFGKNGSSEGSNGTATQNGEQPDSTVAQVDSIGVTPITAIAKSPTGTRTAISANGDTITYYDYAIPEE